MPSSDPSRLTESERRQVLGVAEVSIRYGLRTSRPPSVPLEGFRGALREARASFVTLRHGETLRGCIGTLTAARPLVQDVAANAYAAAFCDPRFRPLQMVELHGMEVHISVLGTPEPMRFSSEHDLISQLRVGVDGLVIEEGRRRGTFLPSVWDVLPDPRVFLGQLKQKAGLPEGYWSASLQVHRYQVESFARTLNNEAAGNEGYPWHVHEHTK